MGKNNIDYHKSAVLYNQAFAETAEKLLLENAVSDPTVRKWVEGIGRLHRFHEVAHERSIKRIQENTTDTIDRNDEAAA